ncbi:MAG: hypothetical protein WCX79_01100 [Candidatus Paceibacterota bacterium]|jgi:uncharacterized coiled-coil DUF342 family protein
MVSNAQAIHEAMMELQNLRDEKKKFLARIQELEGENQQLHEQLLDFGVE